MRLSVEALGVIGGFNVVGSIFFVITVRLVGPVNTDFLLSVSWKLVHYISDETHRLVDSTPVESRHGSFGRARIVVFNEAVIQAFRLKLW